MLFVFPFQGKGADRWIWAFPAALACLGWPPKGSYLFLDKKVAKTQGLELMSD